MHAIPSPAVARRSPLFARFVARVGPQALSPENLIYKYLPIHIAEGIKARELADAPVLVMVDLVVGAGLVAVERLSAGLADEAYQGEDEMSAAAMSLRYGSVREVLQLVERQARSRRAGQALRARDRQAPGDRRL